MGHPVLQTHHHVTPITPYASRQHGVFANTVTLTSVQQITPKWTLHQISKAAESEHVVMVWAIQGECMGAVQRCWIWHHELFVYWNQLVTTTAPNSHTFQTDEYLTAWDLKQNGTQQQKRDHYFFNRLFFLYFQLYYSRFHIIFSNHNMCSRGLKVVICMLDFVDMMHFRNR